MQNQPAHRARRNHHIIYKTTCLVTGKWYIGMHSTNDLDDGYLGSGKRLWYSIKKHGKEQHRREILEHLPDRETLALREEQILTHELKSDPLCMNVAPGGIGHHPGWYTTSESIKLKLGAASTKIWAERRSARLETLQSAPFSMTRDEIIIELVPPNGQLNKNATRNLKPREITAATREAERAKKWNFIREALQHPSFPEASDLELINRFVYQLEERPICKRCPTPVTFFRFGQPYATYCGTKCQMTGNTIRATK